MSVKFPDFSKSKVWEDLRNRINANEDVEFDLNDLNGISMIEIENLKSGSININNIHEHIDPIDQTFVFKGQKVILYIKQQKYHSSYFTKPSYKYHLCYCKTLQEMESKGRFKSRYVVTQRTDGQFLIDVIDAYSGSYIYEDELYKMNVCKNCLNSLHSKYLNDSIFLYDNFNLSNFIKKYNTGHLKRPLHTASSMPKNKYSENWSLTSKKLRQDAGYECSKCQKNFEKNLDLLQVHHKDGVKWNDSKDNLIVLCLVCHSNEPGHKKMKKTKKYLKALELKNAD
tara:strand:+ start:90 stop:941 length:852 start_codon:yes stop_codon:yes gene_type:complete